MVGDKYLLTMQVVLQLATATLFKFYSANSNLSDRCFESTKENGTSISYYRPNKGGYKLSILLFADASKQDDHGQLPNLAGILFRNFESDSVNHTHSRSSRKSQCPVKSITSAENLAADEAID